MLTALRKRIGASIEKFDTTRLFALNDLGKGGALAGLKLPKGGLRTMLLLVAPAKSAPVRTLSIIQEANQRVIGGSTFVLKS